MKHVVRAALFVGVSILVASPSIAQTPADNTKANAQDRSKGAVTADQQKETAADRDVASKIGSPLSVMTAFLRMRTT